MSACVWPAQARASAAAAASAFVDVTVLPMGGRRRATHQTVVVEGGRIASIGPSHSIRVPHGAVRLGGRGQIVMPGLADMHVHIWSADHARLLLAFGVTTVRNMWGADATLQMAASVAAGEMPGPTIYSCGPLIDGRGSYWQGAFVAETPEDARRFVAQSQEMGFPAIKLYARLAPEVFRAGAEEARARGLQVWCHVPESMTLEQVLDIGVDSVEHLDAYEFSLNSNTTEDHSFLARERVWASVDPARIAPLARRLAASGVWSVPTLIVRIARPRSYANLQAALAEPEMQYMDASTVGFWRSAYEATASGDRQQMLAEAEAGHLMRLRMVKEIAQQGAGLMIGSDIPNPFVFPGFSFHQEMRFYEDAGIDRATVLSLATEAPARFLGKEGEFGVVAEGARADLLLLDADPEQSLDALRTPAGVMAAGRWRSAADLAAMRQDIANDMRVASPAGPW